MKKILSLVLLLLIAQTSWANDWFPQQPKSESPKSETPKVQPKLPLEEGQNKMVLLRAPCAPFTEMLATVKKYNEKLLFTANGITFSAQLGTPYSGGLFFYVNQETGSYTILQVFADGMACMLVNGRNFDPFTGVE